MAALSYGCATDTGRVRNTNQDNFIVVPSGKLGGRVDGLFVVADGMGGQAGGEIASRVTVETVPAVVREELAAPDDDHIRITSRAMADALRRGIAAANEAVWKQGRANPELRGMGTTCVAIMVRDGEAVVGNVGDSRAYMLRAGKLTQLTSDHSLVQEHVAAGSLTAEEARGSRFRNVITRGIGIANRVEPDVEVMELEDGDALLLCSDGLTNMIREPGIARILRSSAGAQEACDRLVEAANSAGGVDNITAVVVHHGEFAQDIEADPLEIAGESAELVAQGGEPKRLESRTLVPAIAILSVLVLVLAAALLSVGRESYQLTSSFPFVRHRTPAKPLPLPLPPAQPDLSRLTYGAPVVVSHRTLRPAPLVYDSSGSLYAVDATTGRTIRMLATGEIGGGDFAGLKNPPADAAQVYYATDPQGNLYASIRALHVVQKFTPQGTRVAEIGTKNLKSPSAIAVDSGGSIYVIDSGTLKVFRPAAAPSPQPSLPTTGAGESQRHTTGDPGRQLSVEDRNGSR